MQLRTMMTSARLKRYLVWSILDGPRYLFLAVWGCVLLLSIGWMVVQTVHNPVPVLVGLGLPVSLFLSIFLWKKSTEWIVRKYHTLLQWAKTERAKEAELKEADRRLFEEFAKGVTWSGMGPGEDWYVVSESGGAKAGPMTRERAEELLARGDLDHWGKCTIQHRGTKSDPIREDLKSLSKQHEQK